MASHFTPAKYTAEALRMVPPPPVSGLGFDFEALPQLAPPRNDPAQRVPVTSDAIFRVEPGMPVLESVQPKASGTSRPFQLPNTKGVFSMSNQNPIMCGSPIGGFGAINMSNMQLDRGVRAMPSKTSMMTYAPATLDRKVFSARNLSMFDSDSPWMKYAIYGTAGLAVLGLGYMLLK